MRVVLGVFNERTNAEDAINELKEANFKLKDLSVIMQDSAETRSLVHGAGINVGEGALAGAASGAVIGGLAGLLIGVGAIVIPGIGSVFIGGPLAAALGLTGAAAATTSGAITSALTGGLLGSLMGLGIPKDEATIYEQRVKEGSILLTVPTEISREDVVIAIMEDNDATDIKSFTLPTYYISESDFAEGMTHETYETEPYHPTYAMAGAKGGQTQRKRTQRKRVKT